MLYFGPQVCRDLWQIFCGSSGLDIYCAVAWAHCASCSTLAPCPHAPLKPCFELTVPTWELSKFWKICVAPPAWDLDGFWFHTELFSENFLLFIYFPAGFTGPCTWRSSDPCQLPTPLNTQAQPVHQSPQNRQGKISTVPFKTVSTLKNQQENEQLTKLLHGFEELLISLIGTSYAFISSSEPHQTPARLNHFSWMRNCKSSRLPQQQSGFSSGNSINK